MLDRVLRHGLMPNASAILEVPVRKGKWSQTSTLPLIIVIIVVIIGGPCEGGRGRNVEVPKQLLDSSGPLGERYPGTVLALVENQSSFPVTGRRIREYVIAKNAHASTPGAGP